MPKCQILYIFYNDDIFKSLVLFHDQSTTPNYSIKRLLHQFIPPI